MEVPYKLFTSATLSLFDEQLCFRKHIKLASQLLGSIQ